MAKLRKEIKEMKVARDTKRQERSRNNIPSVAIAGYTNAGKSSLMNRLTNAGVLVENALFATLDPTTRQTKTSDGRVFTLSDTVGFVRHLPHQLVEAFKSTLEEVAAADLIVHVVDGSHPDPMEQIRAVRQVVDEVGGGEIPEIIAINKADIAAPEVMMQILRTEKIVLHFRHAPDLVSKPCSRRSRHPYQGLVSRCAQRFHLIGGILSLRYMSGAKF